jgi:ABC-type bacteriocin/lantibiotic exporter with double-glycine peptidase domain
MTISILFDVISIGSLLPLITFIINKDLNISFLNISFGFNNNFNLVIIIIFLIFSLKIIFEFFYKRYNTNFIIYNSMYFQEKITEKYLNEDYSFFIKKNSSIFLRNINEDIKMLNTNLVLPFITVISGIITFVGFFILLLITSYKVTIIVFFFLSLSSFFFIKILGKKTIFFGEQRKKSFLLLTNFTKQTFDGIRELKLLNKEFLFIEAFKKNLSRVANVSVYRNIFSIIPRMYFELSLVLFLLIIIQFTNEPQLILPTLAIYGAVAIRLVPSFILLISSIQNINFSQAVIDDLGSYLQKKNSIILIKDRNIQINFFNNIKYSNIFFKYNKTDTSIFQDLNIEIKKNSCIGIVGSSGAGKSTLADIISGLLKPDSGNIFIDDSRIDEKNYYSLTEKFSYIQQKIFLFDEILAVNIALETDLKKIDFNSINNVLRFVKLDKFINEVNFKCGQFGSNLSGGQIQRIGIARALYAKKEILIFDETMSNLDNENKENILNLIKELKSSKTIIIISHDKNSLVHCNKIYELKNKIINEINL